MNSSLPGRIVEPKIVEKPWGREIWYAHEERYAGKILEVTKGHALSLQKHERKQETMYLQSGRLLYHLNGRDFEMTSGQCITIHPGDVHRIEALEDATILEVSTPELDDVIRLEDRYGEGLRMSQYVRELGSVPWSRDDLSAALEEFARLYEERPIRDNTGGMKAPHMFGVWFIARWLKPKAIVESGVFQGQSTWLLEQAVPDAELICIEPAQSAIRYRSARATYHTDDFTRLDLSRLSREETLLFFDDHQDAVERVRQCLRLGFRHAIFEDNYPIGHGDCYSLKTALMGGGFVPPELREASWIRKLRARLSPSARRIVPPGYRDAVWLKRVLETYYEIPPVVKPDTTRWGDAWSDARYPTPEPLCSWDDSHCPDVFRQEAKDYTWLCYLQPKKD